MISKLSDLINLAKERGERKRFAVVEATEDEVLRSLSKAEKEGIAAPILIGCEKDIKDCMSRLNIEINENYIILNTSSEAESAAKGVDLIKESKADVLMKGSISTPIFLKAFLNKKTGLPIKTLVTHCAILEIPAYHKLLILTDAAITIEPNLDDKVNIIKNAVRVANSIGIDKPKTALLAANEKVSLKMGSSVDAAILSKMGDRGQLKAKIDGPLAYDVVISKKAAETKKLRSEVAGDADILVADSINSGNAIYKTLLYCGNSTSASLVMGLDVPVILTSRADDEDTKYMSVVASTLIR